MTEADGQTEKGTDGVRPREANATEHAHGEGELVITLESW